MGPAPQRTAHYFSTALGARVSGTSLQCYLKEAEATADPSAFERAYMQFFARTPHLHFITNSCLTPVLQVSGDQLPPYAVTPCITQVVSLDP